MKKIHNYILILNIALFAAVLLPACDENSYVTDIDTLRKVNPPTVASFNPVSGVAGSDITIEGTNLGSIDNVWIGGKEAIIKNRVSQSRIVITVNDNAKTGKIKVQNKAGSAESSVNFTVEYLIPALINYPSAVTITEPALINGTNMQAVTKVFFGNSEARITTRLNTEILVVTPTQPWGTNNVDIRLVYSTANGEQEVTTTGTPVAVSFITPVMTDIPGKGNAGDVVTVLGDNLGIIEKVLIDTTGSMQTMEVPVLAATKGSFSFRLPDTIAIQTIAKAKLTAVYYSTQQMIIHQEFNITIPGQETVYEWLYVTLECQKANAENVFFIAKTGEVLSPCDYAANINSIKNQIDFYISWVTSVNTLQLNNPNNSDQQAKNFRCNGVNLPVEKLPKIVKFRSLDPNNAIQKAWIDKVKNKEIVKISPDMLTGLPTPGTNAPRYIAGTVAVSEFKEGDVIMFQQTEGGNVVRTGFLDIIRIKIADVVNESTVTFNCYYEKL